MVSNLVAWGANAGAELGAGLRTPVQLTPITAAALPAGVTWAMSTYSSGAAILADGSVETWGDNVNGQLGDGTRINKYNPVRAHIATPVAQLALAGAHALALLQTGRIATWGSNTFGTLGNGTTGAGKEDGHGSPVPLVIALPAAAVSVATGGAACFAIDSNGVAYSWGENKTGQLGQGDLVERIIPTAIPNLSDVVKIVAGGLSSVSGHAFALHSDGTVSAWGANGRGQCGIDPARGKMILTPTKLDLPFQVKDVSCGAGHSVLLTTDGRVFTLGGNEYGELGTASPLVSAWEPQEVTLLPPCDAISASYRHSHALCEGVIYSWGWNRYGALGLTVAEVATVPEPVLHLPLVLWVNAGERQGMAAIAGEGPPAPLVAHPTGKPGELRVEWTFPATTNKWWLNWREKVNPAAQWGKIVNGPGGLPSSARGYTIVGLTSGQPAEVKLATHGTDTVNVLPPAILEATPA